MDLKTIIIFFLFITLSNADDTSFTKIFKTSHVEGTLIISSLNDNALYVYNKKRAKHRYTAASTFKIPHTLIALNEKVIQSENHLFKWDGNKRAFDAWNKNQTLESAIAVSCVWCYQQLSEKIPKEKYIDYLSKFDYGNKLIGEDKSSFWLNGDLKISAYEQIHFLKRLYNGDLPIPAKYINTVKKLISLDTNKDYEIKGKSGWDGTVGWYVGYITTNQNVYFFAMNADLKQEQLHLRKEIIYKALQSKQII